MKKASLLFAGAILLPLTAYGAGPFQFYSVTPCRIVDTRGATGATGGPSLQGHATRNFPIYAAPAACGIPSTAKAAALNFVIVAPSSAGNLTVWPYNTAFPLVSTLNFNAGEFAIANGAIVPLTSDSQFNISVFPETTPGPSTADLVIDVTGYFQ